MLVHLCVLFPKSEDFDEIWYGGGRGLHFKFLMEFLVCITPLSSLAIFVLLLQGRCGRGKWCK